MRSVMVCTRQIHEHFADERAGMARKGNPAITSRASAAGGGFSRLRTWPFWRTMILYFCIVSVVGHLIEYPYCWLGMTFFGSVDPTSEVLTNPFKPFFVYGVGVVLCCVLLEPFRGLLLRRFSRTSTALLVFYVVSVFIGMAFELTQGFLQNQPVDGVYPLWDVSDYPGNILGQAWIVNDIFIGALITLIVWVVLPWANGLVERLNDAAANRLCAIVVAATAVLTVVTYL